MDPLSEVLSVTGVRGTLGGRIEAGGRWGVALRGYPGVAVYAVTSGTTWLEQSGDVVELVAGDVVVVPGPTPHTLGSAPGVTTVTCEDVGTPYAELGTAPFTTRVVTLHYECDRTTTTQLLTGLPGLVHVGAGNPGLDDTVRMLARELAHPQIAGSAVVNSLVDILLVQVLRAWMATRPDQCLGSWLGMLTDPVVGRALERMHAEPARGWTTTSLASAISVSRATLARRFPAAVGLTPAAYLTNWRMDLAAVRLRGGEESVETIAAAVGYTSAPAFTRAFSRLHGVSPGRYRGSR